MLKDKTRASAIPGMLEYERMIGAPLWGDEGRALWSERDPAMHLDRVRTPLRIETYEAGTAWWDTYAILRRQGRPVEYWSFPEGSHGLVRPWERLSSQQGAVDWYDFWLNGHENPDPEKAEQYARWRVLRTQRDAVRAEPRPALGDPAASEHWGTN